MDEEKLNKNLDVFKKKFIDYEFYSEKFFDDYGERIKNAPYSKDSFASVRGGLIIMILKITKNIITLNNLLPESKRYDIKTLVKTVFLSQIGKIEILTIGDNNKVDYRQDNVALRTTEHSLRLCNEYGIKLTDHEFQALINLDKENDKQAKFYSEPLSFLLKSATELTEFIEKSII